MISQCLFWFLFSPNISLCPVCPAFNRISIIFCSYCYIAVSDKNARWAKWELILLYYEYSQEFSSRVFEAGICVPRYRLGFMNIDTDGTVSHDNTGEKLGQRWKSFHKILRDVQKKRFSWRVLVIIVSFFIVFTDIWQCVDFTQRPCSYWRLSVTDISLACVRGQSCQDFCRIILIISLKVGLGENKKVGQFEPEYQGDNFSEWRQLIVRAEREA